MAELVGCGTEVICPGFLETGTEPDLSQNRSFSFEQYRYWCSLGIVSFCLFKQCFISLHNAVFSLDALQILQKKYWYKSITFCHKEIYKVWNFEGNFPNISRADCVTFWN